MEEVQGLFIGYRSFISKKNGNNYFVLSFLFIDVNDKNKCATYFVKDIFVAQDDYNQFISEHSLLSSVVLKREIVNDTVRYYI